MVRSTIFVALLLSGGALGQLNVPEQAKAIAFVREYALNYTRRLPNYTCTQTTRHTWRGGMHTETGSFEEQLSFVDKQEIRKLIRIDGYPPPPNYSGRAATVSWGEFGNLLDTIFEPATGADLRFDRVATLNQRRVYVFAFRVPQPKGYLLVEAKGTRRVPFQGFVYADSQSGAVLRIQMKCTDIPDHSEYQAVGLTLDYKPAEVAGAEFILPSHFALNYRTDIGSLADSSDFTKYRRFSADTSIQFDPQ
jgi:hypothetical protein